MYVNGAARLSIIIKTETIMTALQKAIETIKRMAGEFENQRIPAVLLLSKILPLLEYEEEREYEMKCFWFGRGINAAKTDGIGKLKPKRIDQ